MGDFKKSGGKRFAGGRNEGYGSREGGRPNFSAKSWGGGNDRDRGPITMHQATCGQCGKACEVPFRPISGKTVYCRDCFQNQKGEQDERGGGGYPQRKFGNRTFSKPDFRHDDVKGCDNGLKSQLEILNAKMDRLIRIIEAAANTKPLPIPEIREGAAVDTPVIKVRKTAKKSSKKNVRPF